jgi:hydroxyethylthiazole kinase-like uncharacterized protein yjeF
MASVIHELQLDDLRAWLKPRAVNAHKGDFGSVGVLGGASGMVGAALLAGRSALWTGAGRVFVGMIDTRLAVDSVAPELMLCEPARVFALDPPACLAVGPGLGQSKPAEQLLTEALRSSLPLVLDADALNLIARDPVLQDQLRERASGQTVLTPHPAEAARLLGCATEAVQSDRVAAVENLVQRFACVVVLKGAGSLILAPGAALLRNPTGNAGMASAGMGDVLTGLLAAQVAQGLSLLQATQFAVYLHGAAADAAVASGIGPIGLTASEVAQHARHCLNRWISS